MLTELLANTLDGGDWINLGLAAVGLLGTAFGITWRFSSRLTKLETKLENHHSMVEGELTANGGRSLKDQVLYLLNEVRYLKKKVKRLSKDGG